MSNGVDFAHPNVLGSDTQMTDYAGHGGQAILYYPWGQVWSNPSNLFGNTFYQRYASLQLYDTATDGYVPPFRYYIPEQGRWLTPDPLAGNIFNPQSLNRYAYVGNNPTTLVDPLGLDGHGAPPPCGGPNQIPCSQYFMIIGPAGICPPEFSSCYATLGGATIGVNGINATAFTFGTPVNTVGQPCNAQVIADGECAGGLSGTTVVGTGVMLPTGPVIMVPGPIEHTIGPAPDPNQTTITAAQPEQKPGCFAYGVAVALGLDSFLEPGGGNNMPSVVPDTAKKEARDEAIKLVAQRVGGKAALATGNKIIFALGVYDYFKTLEKGFQGRIAGKCSPLVP